MLAHPKRTGLGFGFIQDDFHDSITFVSKYKELKTRRETRSLRKSVVDCGKSPVPACIQGSAQKLLWGIFDRMKRNLTRLADPSPSQMKLNAQFACQEISSYRLEAFAYRSSSDSGTTSWQTPWQVGTLRVLWPSHRPAPPSPPN